MKFLITHFSLVSCYFIPLTSKYSPQHPVSFPGIALSVQRRDTGWTSGDRLPAEATNFSLVYSVQTGSGAHRASYPMSTEGCFPRGKAAVAWS
jgi:hypothetical protein